MMRFDAVVIGAGPAGSTAATILARKGWQVAVVEKTRFPRRKVCGEFLSATSIAVLDRLGAGRAWREEAGPEVRRLALFSGDAIVEAPMPAAGSQGFGRALGRDRLDALLLETARAAGAEVLQPSRAVAIEPEGQGQAVRIAGPDGERCLWAPVVVAAHGSWEPGGLPSQSAKLNRPSDYLGFKAYFRNGRLDADLMPLLAFPGGYGGMVWADEGRLSISCCIRRDALERLRLSLGAKSAAEAVHRHLLRSSKGIRQSIGGAGTDGAWLAAGPIRPGIRHGFADDIFRIGNAAGESHPIIAEGISMAIQSGWMLGRMLDRQMASSPAGRIEAGHRYARAWHAQFATRIRAAELFARLAGNDMTARLATAGVRLAPRLLTAGARLGGKTKPAVV